MISAFLGLFAGIGILIYVFFILDAEPKLITKTVTTSLGEYGENEQYLQMLSYKNDVAQIRLLEQTSIVGKGDTIESVKETPFHKISEGSVFITDLNETSITADMVIKHYRAYYITGAISAAMASLVVSIFMYLISFPFVWVTEFSIRSIKKAKKSTL